MPVPNKSYDELINRRRQATMATFRAWNPTVNIKGQDASTYTEYVAGNRPYIVQTFGGERIEEPIVLPSSSGGPGETEYVDRDGNIYTVGIYASTALSIYNSNGNLADTLTKPAGGYSMFIIKYTPSGTVLWATKINSTGSGATIGTFSLCADKLGNIYVSGHYINSSLSIYNANGSLYKTITNDSSPTTNNNIFIVKYSSSGVALWATQLGGTLVEFKPVLVCDKTNNIYVSCQYASSPLKIYNSDATYQTLPNSGSNDVALVKYNTDGFVSWATRIAGTSMEFIGNICIDSNDNIYITGRYASTTVIIYDSDGTSKYSISNSTGFNAAYVITYNSSGICMWANKILTTTSIESNAITVDNNDNSVYIVGYFTGTLTIYNSDGNSTLGLTSASSYTGYIIKYDNIGMGLWALKYTEPNSQNIINNANIDSNGNIYIVGNYGSVASITFKSSDNITTKTLTKTGITSNGYIVKYDSNCIVLWAINVDATTSSNVFGISIDKNNELYVSGIYGGTLTVKNAENAASGLSLTGLGSIDGFIIKYNADGIANWATRIGGTDIENNIYITTPYFLGV